MAEAVSDALAGTISPIAHRTRNGSLGRPKHGELLGGIRNYFHPRQDIWERTYKGEIVAGNRLLRIEPAPTDDRGPNPPLPLPSVPRIPDPIEPISLPSGYRDVDLPA